MNCRNTVIRAAAAFIALATSAIAIAADKDEFEQRAEKVRSGPASAPVENETGFGKGLKCMDGLFRAFGIRNVTIVIDEIPDATKKVNVGARDMLMSATSQMTRTTHAIRLIPVVESKVFTDSQRQRVVGDSDFVIQGSISQYDDSMLKKQRDGAVCLWYLCIGAADSDSFSGLGLDLNLVETAGMSLIPGANVHNAVLIRKKGKGYDGDLTYKKWSVQYNFTLVANDGNGQALRTLIDLGAIEMYGRLLKLPYWSCLGASDEDPGVKAEIDDWWEEMAGDPRDRARLFAYLQVQMKAQGVYDGAVNGRVDPALMRAIRAYRIALGQPDDLNLDSSFLRKYLAADQAVVRKLAVVKLEEIAQKEGPLPPPVAQSAPPAPTTATAANTTTPPSAPPVAGTGGAAPAVAQASPSPRPGVPSPVAAAQPSVPAPLAAAQPAAASPIAAAQPAAPSPSTSTQPAAHPATGPAPAAAQTSTAPVQPVAPAPVAAAQSAVARPVAVASAPQSQPVAGLQKAAYRPAVPVATIPIEGSRPANDRAYRAGEPFYVGVISPRDGYLYCYLVDDQQRISQFYPAPAQSSTRLSGGTLTVVNSESPLLASRPERKEKVACFSSPKDLGRQPLDAASIVGLDSLKTRFAVAVSGAYAMGVFDVKVQ